MVISASAVRLCRMIASQLRTIAYFEFTKSSERLSQNPVLRISFLGRRLGVRAASLEISFSPVPHPLRRAPVRPLAQVAPRQKARLRRAVVLAAGRAPARAVHAAAQTEEVERVARAAQTEAVRAMLLRAGRVASAVVAPAAKAKLGRLALPAVERGARAAVRAALVAARSVVVERAGTRRGMTVSRWGLSRQGVGSLESKEAVVEPLVRVGECRF